MSHYLSSQKAHFYFVLVRLWPEKTFLSVSLSHKHTKMACLRFGNSVRGRTGQGWVESCRLSDWKHSVAEALFFNPPDNIVPALFIFLLELLLNIPPSLSLHYILSASSGVHFHYRDLSHSPFRCHSCYCVVGIFRLAVPTNSSHRFRAKELNIYL